MMFFRKNQLIHLELILYLLLVITMMGVVSVEASGCGVLKIQKNRSTGATILNNQCGNGNELSLQSIIQIQGNARVWLESISQETENYWVICQNRSTMPVNINVISSLSPWIRPGGDNQCAQWTNQRLECRETNTQLESLLCAVSQIKKLPNNEVMQRTSSLTIRGLTRSHLDREIVVSEGDSEVIRWKMGIQPGIELCRKVFDTHDPLTVSWVINKLGESTDIQVLGDTTNPQLVECIAEMIGGISFPTFEKTKQIKLSF